MNLNPHFVVVVYKDRSAVYFQLITLIYRRRYIKLNVTQDRVCQSNIFELHKALFILSILILKIYNICCRKKTLLYTHIYVNIFLKNKKKYLLTCCRTRSEPDACSSESAVIAKTVTSHFRPSSFRQLFLQEKGDTVTCGQIIVRDNPGLSKALIIRTESRTQTINIFNLCRHY